MDIIITLWQEIEAIRSQIVIAYQNKNMPISLFIQLHQKTAELKTAAINEAENQKPKNLIIP